MSKLYFFRHAQASFGAKNYDVLSPKGEEQAKILGQYLVDKKFSFDKIFVGPLRRQQHTFEIVKSVYDQHQVPMPKATTIEGLKEHSGTQAFRTGMPLLIESTPKVKAWYDEMAKNPALAKRNNLLAFEYFLNEWVEGKIELEGIEPWANFRSSVKEGLKQILDATGKGETIASFTSGGTISSITAESLFLKDEKRIAAMNFSIRNTSFTSFLYSKGRFNLLSLNELPHLEKEMVTFI